ncbi:hypothetical protein C8A00DRAFT_16314 [Chaetomidium leptoderma]|uniref:Uncharacterized protein n=1 Tax=Chaetomidium leptoderma TaxID=669021 RepID=A0AAN6ZVE2_9PEZI|nr:hypothetical protein C8A00DRAFT_16314 [Chaetomidium leptoderma]
MFGSRRHRAPNPPLTAATANPNAASAAAAVFKRHESNSSLSAAAAAAALRARPTTPIRVADVQTKRTLRRSTQSFSNDMPPVPALPRNMDTASGESGGRAQQGSPHRKANSLRMGTTPVRLASQKLASGESPSWFGGARLGDLGSVRRTDPAMASPPSSPLQVSAREEDPSEGARPGSQASSLNFSYPTRARRGSGNFFPAADPYATTQVPTHMSQTQPSVEDRQPAQTARVKQPPKWQAAVPSAKKQSTPSSSDQTLVYDPNSRRMVPQADLLALQHVQQTVLDASQPTSSRKKKRTPQRAGSHLAAGTMGRTKSQVTHPPPPTKVQPSSAVAEFQPQREVKPAPLMEPVSTQETRVDAEEPAVKAIISSPRIEAKRLEQQRAQKGVELPRITVPTIPTLAPAAPDVGQFAVRRQPSMVREEPEPEEAEDEMNAQRAVSDALDAVPARRRMQAQARPETHPPISPAPNTTVPSNSFPGNSATVRVDPRPETGSVDVSEYWKAKPSATEHGRAACVSHERTHSSSPARQAHFGPVQDSLTVKHSPPPRSISPRKSAMKHATSPRDASPSGDTSEGSGSVNQEPPVARRKSVRVSFDDAGNGAAGESASINQNDSPLAASPLHANRHSWLTNLGRSHVPSYDDDMVMKPRPALPSFGSVRNRKPRETSPDQTERPLVRPKGEMKYTSPLLPSPPLSSSHDHALGAVLSNENGRLRERSEHLEDDSGHGEPLPPVVTSVEGTGYFSDSSDASSNLSSEFEQSEASFPTAATGPRSEPTAGSHTVLLKAPINGSAVSPVRGVPPQVTRDQGTSLEPEVPAISVSQPTPLGAENKSLGQYFTDIPGGYPEEESDQSAASAAKRPAPDSTVVQPTEDIPQGNQPAQLAAQTTQPTTAETSSDSESDVYSDAYEDLSDIEGDGFQSLNAVVESPLQQSPRPALQAEQASREAPSQGPVEEMPKLQTEISSATTAVEMQPPESPQDDWEKAKAYWRSLTAEKRAQLEREASEEAGIEADKDEAQAETKPKKKKAIERRNSKRRSLAIHMAHQMMVQQEKDGAANPDRSYMIKPGEQWTGDDQLDIPPIRKTMRNEPQPQQHPTIAPAQGSRLRKSMRASASGPSGHRPPMAKDQAASKSGPVAVTPPRTSQRRSATPVEPVSGKASYAQPPLTRRGSTGSESSFKRSRFAKGQGFGFRHSMRPTSPPSLQGEDRSATRFSLRTMSAAGSGSPPGPQMRTTLRDSSNGRKSPTGICMPSFSLSYGGGKKRGSGGKPSGSKSTGSRFSSRFADSSDEEGRGGVSSGFRSRFEESSDDEPVMPMPAPLPRSASAPHTVSPAGAGHHHLRKESSIASTALPEELEESEESQDSEAPTIDAKPALLPATAAVNTSLRRTRSGRGQLLPGAQTAPSLSQAAEANNNNTGRTSRRTSIMSVLRHRKKDSAAPKIGRPDVSESAARRDTRLERSVGQLEQIRSRGDGEDDDEAPPPAPAAAAPRSPRLIKRGSSGRSIKRTVVVPEMMGGGSRPAQGGGATTTVTATASASPEGGGDLDSLLLLQGAAEEGGDVFDMDAARQQQLKRSTASGNLGTRTLSSGGGFLQRRVSALGGGGGMDVAPSMNGSVAGGSMAGASSTTRKKRFGTLRRIFRLDD